MISKRLLCLSLVPFALAACQKSPSTGAVEADLALESDTQVYSYGVGYQIGSQMASSPLDMDGDSMIAGLRDALDQAEPRVEQERLQEVAQRLQSEMQEQQAAQSLEASEENAAAAAAFLEKNGAEEGVVTTESGLQYRIIDDAEGERPAETDTVVVHYRGSLLDGTEFDSSYKRGEPATFPISAVIKGWQEALQLMPVGSKWEVYIPPELAYGSGGQGPIPPSSALVFEVELIEIKPEPEPEPAS